MNKIFKYSVPVKEMFTMDLPRDATIIRVEDVDGQFFLWAIVNTEEGYPTEKRYFECYKTGQEIKTPLQYLKHIGTMKLFIMQELCLYVFENVCTVRPFKTPTEGMLPSVAHNNAVERSFALHPIDVIADGK